MTVSEATFRRLADEDHEGKWELLAGRLRSKPSGTFGHNTVVRTLLWHLSTKLSRSEWCLVHGLGWLSHGTDTFLIPDVAVVGRNDQRRLFSDPDVLEVYPVPLPFVVEVAEAAWLQYDVHEKIAVYCRRGDAEVWLIDPWMETRSDRSLTIWRRRPDGGYTERRLVEGMAEPSVLSGISIDLSELFEFD
jgi:Uma2 family endonuclease